MDPRIELVNAIDVDINRIKKHEKNLEELRNKIKADKAPQEKKLRTASVIRNHIEGLEVRVTEFREEGVRHYDDNKEDLTLCRMYCKVIFSSLLRRLK
uniref:Uncharacterized protein n=1 Tax=Strigamia maritima TaxID=126957 RepID=T1JI91_STRMM